MNKFFFRYFDTYMYVRTYLRIWVKKRNMKKKQKHKKQKQTHMYKAQPTTLMGEARPEN